MGTNIPGQIGFACNGNEAVTHITQSSRLWPLLSDGFVSYPKYLWKERILPIHRDDIGAFYGPNQPGLETILRNVLNIKW